MIIEDEEDQSTEKKSNLDWNKKSFETAERLTLKINVHEALKYQAQKSKTTKKTLPQNLKNLRKKVRSSYDEEEEDGVDEDILQALRDLQINLTDASNGDNTLLSALSPNERRLIDQNTNIEITRHEQNAGRLNALLQANTLSRKAGISKMSAGEFANQMQDAIYNPRRTKLLSLEKNIAKKMGIRGDIKKHSVGKVVEGVKRVKETTGNRKVKQLNLDDVKIVGKKKMSQNETAELILRKSGQTARLSEIKMKNSYDSNTASKTKRSYSQEMKELLKESLRKNDKVR